MIPHNGATSATVGLRKTNWKRQSKAQTHGLGDQLSFPRCGEAVYDFARYMDSVTAFGLGYD